jgi:hypothetical protein
MNLYLENTFIWTVYVDASNNCNELTFQFGQTGFGTNIGTRSWSIKVSNENTVSQARSWNSRIVIFYSRSHKYLALTQLFHQRDAHNTSTGQTWGHFNLSILALPTAIWPARIKKFVSEEKGVTAGNFSYLVKFQMIWPIYRYYF